LFQSVFQVREVTEERERLSLEVQLPLTPTIGTALDVRKLAQVFGRGVGVTRDPELLNRSTPVGKLDFYFPGHDSAPLSSLYHLDAPYPHLHENDLTIVLRRDGHVALASLSNPLLEFYDGGWHVVDLQSGRSALNLLLDDHFSGASYPPSLAQSLLRLAYHLATHWHGGILAVVRDEAEVEGILAKSNDQSQKISTVVQKELDTKDKPPRITAVGESGVGRVLLSCAIQDGATLFNREGEFLCSGRMVKETVGSPMEGGARRRAARTLSRFGVVLAISHDGAIRIFSEPPGLNYAVSGLRIH
jgi:hypothetical protein